MSHKARLWYVHIVGCDWTFLYLLVVLTSCLSPTAVYSCSDCTETLTDPSGQFTSPCYPKDYVSNLNCEWTILAPPGFIIQLTFHNFELEEAQGCPYDFISINTGAEEIIFCGVTAKGHTLNSTTNRMIVKFATDFSVQKRGFSTTYRQVAVSLRNQKVVVDRSSKMQAVLVSPSISIPELGQFTVCLEATLTIARHNWVLFSYMDSNDLKLIDFRREWSKILLVISDVECDMSNIFKDHFSEEVFNGNWRQLCMAWDGASGNVSIQTQNKHLINPCPDSIGKGITSKGTLTLAPKQHPSSKTFSGQLYNFRLWNFTMSGETLNNLPCGEKGNVVDWDNSDWDIPVSMLTADHQLSCASALPTPSTVRPSCSSLGSGCQASSPANSNTLPTNTHSTNSVDPSAHGSNSTFIEVTTPGFIETTELTEGFNNLDLQRLHVLLSRSRLNKFRPGPASPVGQESGRFRNPLGIISTPLRFPLRPRPSTLKPGLLNMQSSSILFGKTVTKSSRVTEDLQLAADGITEESKVKKHLLPSFFLGITNATGLNKKNANGSGMTSDRLSKLNKLVRQFWDSKLAGKNSTGNRIEDSFEISPFVLKSHKALTELGTNTGIETLSLKPSISSILSTNQYNSGQSSPDRLSTMEIQPQTQFLMLHHPVIPTPTRSLHELRMASVVSPRDLLQGSLWTMDSDWTQFGSGDLLGDQFITEMTEQSLQSRTESTIDPNGPTFSTHHSNASTGLQEDYSALSSWQVGSIISTLPLERGNNSVSDTWLTHTSGTLRSTDNGSESSGSTKRLFISTEQIANQLRGSGGFMWHHGPFTAINQEDGSPGIVKDMDKGSLISAARSHTKKNHADALTLVPSSITSDMANISTIPDGLLDISLRPSGSDFSVGLNQLKPNPGKWSQGSPGSSNYFSISTTQHPADNNAIELQPASETSVQWGRASVTTRALESLPGMLSPMEDSPWSLPVREANPSLLPASARSTGKGYSQVSLTAITQLKQPVMKENTRNVTTIKNTGSLTLYASSISPFDASHLENESLASDSPHPGEKSSSSNTLHPSNDSITSNTPHSGNGFLKSDVPYSWNNSLNSHAPNSWDESLTTDTSNLGKVFLTSDIPHPGNGSLNPDVPHSLTSSSPDPRNEFVTSNAYSERDLGTLQRKNYSLTSDGPHMRINSSGVPGSLSSSPKTSVASAWSSWAAPLDQRPEMTSLFQSLEVYTHPRSENAALVHLDYGSELGQVPSLTPYSFHGPISQTAFPSFLLTVPGPFQDNWEVSQGNYSGVIVGSYTFPASATPRESGTYLESEVTLLTLSPDQTENLVEETSEILATLENSKGRQTIIQIPVEMGAECLSPGPRTPSLSNKPQFLRSSGIFTGTESELALLSRSVQSLSDLLKLNITPTSHVKTLQHLMSEEYVKEQHAHNLAMQLITGVFSRGTQLNLGSQEPLLVPTLPLDFAVATSIHKWAWENGMSTDLDEQVLKDSPTSTTLRPKLQANSSSSIVPSSPGAPGFSGNLDSSLEIEEPPVTSEQASRPCLCVAIVRKGCLCRLLIDNRGVFYWTQFMVYDRSSEVTDIEDLKDKVSTWLTKSLQNWNYSMSVDNVSIFKSNGTPHHIAYRSIKDRSYNCLAILYYNISQNIHLEEQMVKERLRNTSSIIGDNLSIVDIRVQPIENCPSDEYPENYMWLETRPRVTIYIACSSNPAQNASRECFLNTQNYTSHWKNPDLINCTNNSGSESTVKKVNHLLDLSRDNLTPELVDKLVVKLQEVVTENVINSTLATTMITVMSNILSGSDTVLASSSNLALKTIDALMAKMIFSGPSVNINKPNLAIGILAVDSQTFNGTSFSVGQGKESSLEVSLDGKPPEDTLADIELSPSLLERLSEEEMSAVSRIQFAFFKRTGLFQGQQRFRLQSFVVASSVGNISINNLSEPVKIRIKLKKSEQETSKMHCAFWDFALKNGSGGWKTDGCWADPKSGANETICFCNHLTHFGVLMDISRTAPQLDMVNIRILTFITHIGCGISAIFSATTLLTYVAFEKLRRDYPSKILMNLSTSLFFLNFTFLIDGWLASFNVFGLCVTVAALLHFFLLTSFTWMGLEAIHMYIALVKVFNTYIRKYILKFCIIGWGLPALMVLIVLAINSKNRNIYGISVYGKDSTDSGTTEFCWINDRIVFYVTCVCYFAILFLMNVSMFIVVLIQICGRNGKKSHRNMREEVLRNLRSATSLTFLLGMTWGFAFFAWGPLNLIFMYLFAIFNSLQDWSRTITNNTKKVSSENLGKSLSNSSIGSNSTSWTSKFKSGSSLFKSSTKGSLFSTVPSAKFGHLDPHQEPEVATNNIMDRTACYYPTHSDNFYKNLMMSDNFSHSTKF